MSDDVRGMLLDIATASLVNRPVLDTLFLPDDLVDLGVRISNQDDELIESGTEERLRAGDCYCGHSAWEFYGLVWFGNGVFHEEVRRYRASVDHLTAPTLAELVDVVREKWGKR